jgi:transmembrane sensor
VSDTALAELARRHGLPPAALEQALAWLVARWSKEMSPSDEERLAHWRAADPQHERAWQRVQGLDDWLAAAVTPVGGQRLRAARDRIGRRAAVKALALLALGTGSYGVVRSGAVRRQLADLRTSTGEIRTLALADGTRLTLGTRTAVDLHFTARERRLNLLAGEIAIATARDPGGRPFSVETPIGTITPIGTRFSVRLAGGYARVAVEQGAILVQPRGASGRVRLDAGQQLRFGSAGADASEPLAAAAVTWQRGVLVAERWRLADVLTEVARYRSGIVRCDPAVADLIVSGTYPLTDTDRILDMLAGALPVRIEHVMPLWVAVQAREK